MIVLGKEGHLLRAHGSNEAIGGGPTKFYGMDQVRGDSSHSVYPLEGSAVACNLTTDPIAGSKAVGECCYVLGDA